MTTWRHVAILAGRTFIEAVRQRVFSVLLLFALVVIGSAALLTGLTVGEQLKFVKDGAFGAMMFFGLLLAVIGAAQAVPSEIERGTLAVLLARPVSRGAWLWGKACGLALVMIAALGIMAAVSLGVLALEAGRLAAAEPTPERAAALWHQALDPAMGKALLLVAMKLWLAEAIALFLATFATSTLFAVTGTFLIYLIGHLEGIAREAWLVGGAATAAQKGFLAIVALLVPDLGAFGIIDDLLAGTAVPWSTVGSLAAYAAIYGAVLLAIGQLIFHEREF